MKKHSFGQNNVIYNFRNNSNPGNYFNKYMNRTTILIVSFIAIAVGVYYLLKGAIYTTQVDFTITNVTTNKQVNYDIDSGRSTSVTTTYDLEGTTGGPCGNQRVTMLGYPSPVSVGQTIKAWVKKDCIGLVAEHDIENSRIIGIFVILIAIGVIIFNLFIKK